MIKLLALTFIWAFAAFAGPLSVEHVDVKCEGNSDCESLSGALGFLQREYTDLGHLKETIRLYVLNEGISSFEYALKEDKAGVISLLVDMKVKQTLLNYTINLDKDPGIDLPTVLPIREGEYIDEKSLYKTRSLLVEVLQGQGYPDASVNFQSAEKKDGIELKILIDLGEPIFIESVRTHSDSDLLAEIARKSLAKFENKNFYLQRLKSSIEELRLLFIDYGYYLASINLDYDIDVNRKASVDISIKSNDLHVFYPVGNEFLSSTRIKKDLKNTVLSYKRLLPVDTVSQKIKSLYEENGFWNTEVSVEKTEYKNSRGESVNRYNISIEENNRTSIDEIRFSGNTVLSSKRLRALFYEKASEVIKSGYFQKGYVDNFIEAIREEYIIRGYVNVIVEEPKLHFVDDFVYVGYRVREGSRAIVESISFEGLPPAEQEKLAEIINNKEKRFFNPVTFKTDLEVIERRLRQQGYFFAKIKNKNSRNIVEYRNDNSLVNIRLEIELGQVLRTDQIIIIGNRKTRSKLIKRELVLKKNELVTREKIQISQTNLLGLGIFSSVMIEPISSEGGKSDILVTVREKDFGIVELAPGVRSDIGVKVSGNISYNNLDGMNKRISVKGQVNQRFNLNSLDERRREESNSLIEYDLAGTYGENHIFGSETDFSASLSSSRKRFFSFDADIQRLNFTFNRELNEHASISLRPQFENIEQFDATSELDEGTFQIGSLTPGLTLDYRNNRINPTAGAWFNMSVEMANPALGSQSSQESSVQGENLTINYYKLISRNRFYLPFKGGTFAMSLAAGIEENLGEKGEGYIPNIKVFRLNGVDIVRGFEDDEINRLPSGQDISEVSVDKRAYMAVIKLEPRIFLSDSTMMGVFYDAGRVMVNTFEPDELRSSVGITFKYLTPVGSLDFDYGIKLLRKTYDDGMVDSPGRLHVSIGFF